MWPISRRSRRIQIDESVAGVQVTVRGKRCEEDHRARESKTIDRGRRTTRSFVPLEDRRVGSRKMSGRRRVFSALNGLKCDRAIVWSVLLWCSLVFLSGNVESAPPGICAMDGCNCTVKAHRWINVKCVFSDDQVNETKPSILRFVTNLRDERNAEILHEDIQKRRHDFTSVSIQRHG